MDKHIIKRLAEKTIAEGKLNEDIALFAISKLPSRDLRKYEFYIKQLIKKSTVYVTSAEALDQDTIAYLHNKYTPKKVQFHTDSKLGGGIVIRNNDDVLDASINGMIHNIVKKVEEQL